MGYRQKESLGPKVAWKARLLFLWSIAAALETGTVTYYANKALTEFQVNASGMSDRVSDPGPARVIVSGSSEGSEKWCNGTNLDPGFISTAGHCVADENGELFDSIKFSPDEGKSWIPAEHVKTSKGDYASITYDPRFEMSKTAIADPKEIASAQTLLLRPYLISKDRQIAIDKTSLIILGWVQTPDGQILFVGEPKEDKEPLIRFGTSGACLETVTKKCAAVLWGMENPEEPGENGEAVRQGIINFGYNPEDFSRIGLATVPTP